MLDASASAVALRAAIADGSLSPSTLLEDCLARIERSHAALNAVVARDDAAARAAAEAAEAAQRAGQDLGPLMGLPVLIKDEMETAGLTTTFGSPLYRTHVPRRDAPLVARLRAAGAIVLGKTNLPEFGAGAYTDNEVYGFTPTPFDLGRSAGGSSGGSAVALAADLAPLATGSDLGGSLRIPAAFCGVYGLRPTPGRIAKPDAMQVGGLLSVVGPMARSVADLALLYDAMAGAEPSDPLSNRAPQPAARPRDLGALKIAASVDLGFAPMEGEVRRSFEARIAGLAPRLDRLDWRDPAMAGARDCFQALRGVGFLVHHGKQYSKAPDSLGPNVRANVALGLELTAADVAAAELRRGQILRAFVDFMADYDALVCPASPVPPLPKGQPFPETIDGVRQPTYVDWLAITFGLTLTGHPVIALPWGLDHHGLPFGVQLVGRLDGERELLEVARALEALGTEDPDFARPLPDPGPYQ